MRVEIGAGGRTLPGWLGVDLNPRRADVVASALQLPFRDAALSAMRAIDVLEHLSYRVTDLVLAEWARACQPGAELFIQVPDADTIMRRYVEAEQHGAAMRLLPIPAGQGLPRTALAGAQWRLLGGHDDGERVDTAAGDDWRWNAHYSMWSRFALAAAFDRAGFEMMQCPTNSFPNIQATARRR